MSAAQMATAGLREMAWRDIDTLADLEARLFPEDAWSPATWWRELAERPRREYVVVERDGTLAAYGGIDVTGEVADVMTVAVAPAARGQGLGAAVLDELLARARGRGATAMLLEVRADNAGAIRLYERRGFETISVRRRYYQPGDVDAHVMRAHLGTTAAQGDSRDAT